MMGLMLPMTEISRDNDIVKLAYTRTTVHFSTMPLGKDRNSSHNHHQLNRGNCIILRFTKVRYVVLHNIDAKPTN